MVSQVDGELLTAAPLITHPYVLPMCTRNKVYSEKTPTALGFGGPQTPVPQSQPEAVGLTYPVFPFQGGDAAAGAAKVRSAFWPALQMNWRVWTPVQFINVNYVPIQVRLPHRPRPQGTSLHQRPFPISLSPPCHNLCFLGVTVTGDLCPYLLSFGRAGGG